MKMSMQSLPHYAGIQPPLAPPENNGQRLLSLVRSLEKNEDHDNDDELLEVVIESFQQWIALIARRGLLRGDVQMAEKVLQLIVSKNSSSNNNNVGGGHNKRGKKNKNHGPQTNDLTIIPTNDNPLSTNNNNNNSETKSLDVQLLLSAPLRILQTRADYAGKILLVALSCELVMSMSEFVKDQSSSSSSSSSLVLLSPCIMAEYELLAQSGKAILAGIETTVRDMLSDNHTGTVRLSGLQAETTNHALQCCFKCASSLIGLFGTKLSRSGQLLANLEELAWETMAMEKVNEAAALLIATIPFAGSSNKQSPAELWNRCVADAIGSMAFVLKVVAPLGKSILTLNDSVSDKTRDHLRKHVQILARSESEDEKVQLFLGLLNGITQQFVFLLTRPALAPMASVQLTECEINLDWALQLMDVMIGFSTTAEFKYFGTKKRLRHETVEKGLLSYNTLAVAAANHVKLFGLKLFSALIDSSGRSLLPQARKIYGLLLNSILSSSSLSLREMIDTASAFRSNRKVWLHTSLKTRQASIDTFQSTLVALGYDSQPSSDHDAPKTMIAMSACDKALIAVAGTLVEQVTANSIDDQWGTTHEVDELILSCSNCMAASLLSDGSFLTIKVRECFDSVALCCLESLSRFPSPVKAAFLRLATACASTPWQDGTSSSIRKKLSHVALECSQAEDTLVCLAARSALTLCETLANPRVPAITFVTKPVESDSNLVFDSMASQLSELRSSISNESKRQKESTEEVKSKKQKIEQNVPSRQESVKEEKSLTKSNETLTSGPDIQEKAITKDKDTYSLPSIGQETAKPEPAKVVEQSPAESERKAQDDDDDEEFPDIVDCAPDEEDKEEDE